MRNYTAVILFFSWFIYSGCATRQPVPATGFIKAGNLNVYYERQGKGDAVLLLHAGLQEHTMWKEQVKELSKQYEVITIDLPYHGKTTGSDTTLLAQDVIKIVLDSLQVQKTSIAGLSMGASVVQDFIIAYPQRVNKAFLISAGVNGYDKKFPVDSVSMDWYNQFSAALKAKDTARAALEFTKAWAEGIYRRGDSLKKPVSQYVYTTTLATLKHHRMEGWPKLNDAPAAMDKLSTIQLPVLLIEGDKDLPYVKACGKYMENTIPGAKRIIMKDVAHMLNMEKPAELNRMMLDFLKGK